MRDFLIRQHENTTSYMQEEREDLCSKQDSNGTEKLPSNQMCGSVFIQEYNVTASKTNKMHDESIRKTYLDSITDLFYVNDRFARRIFVSGEEGRMLSQKMIYHWCKAKMLCTKPDGKKIAISLGTKDMDLEIEKAGENESESGNKKPLGGTSKSKSSKLEQICAEFETTLDIKDEDEDLRICLSLFDLVFHVPLCHAKHGISSIVDLVCDSVSECDQKTKKNIKQLLADGNVPCLVILDNLDEYNVPETCREREFPDGVGLENCVVLCTMRQVETVHFELDIDITYDNVVQILGLKGGNVEKVLSNILVHFYGLQNNSSIYEQKLKYFCEMTHEQKSIMRIPSLLTASCHVWNKMYDCGIKESTQSFLSLFYLKVTDAIITRSETKHDTVRTFLCERGLNSNPSFNIPTSILSQFNHVMDFVDIIKPVGRLALRDLMLEEPLLVFPKSNAYREFGQSIIELALKAGILSQTYLPNKQKCNLSFFHKSTQEFIAALSIALGDTEALIAFCKLCKTIKKVFELSNMIQFVCGLNPVVGCQLSEHLKNVVNSDTDVLNYRLELGRGYGRNPKFVNKIGRLFSMQCKWFSEMKHNLSYSHGTRNTCTFHVSDVLLSDRSSKYDMMLIRDLLSMEGNSIVSVWLDTKQENQSGCYLYNIIESLPGCNHLTSLYIEALDNVLNIMAHVLPKLEVLECVTYIINKGSYSTLNCTNAIGELPALKSIALKSTETNATIHQTLTKRNCLQEFINISSIYRCSHLKYLKLDNIEINESWEPNQLTMLETVELVEHKPVISALFILQSLCHCSQLRRMNLTSIRLIKQVSLTNWPLLEFLELGHIDRAQYIISSLCKCRQLKHIKLANIELTTPLMLSQLPLLETVEIDHVKDEDFILPYLWQCNQLKNITLKNMKLADTMMLPHQLENVELHQARCLIFMLPSLLSSTHITSLSIISQYDHEVLASVLPRLVHLQYLYYGSYNLDITTDSSQCLPIQRGAGVMSVVTSLQQCFHLRRIELWGIDLCDNDITIITPHMTQLEKVKLTSVSMPTWMWEEFISSLLNVQKSVTVTLRETNIDTKTKETIRYSPLFRVTEYSAFKFRVRTPMR